MSTRESILAVATLAVGLGALTWWGAGSRTAQWTEIGRSIETFRSRKQMAERLVGRRAEIEGRLDALLRDLPRHPPEKDVTADLLKLIETTAAEQGLTLTRREPEREKTAGEIYEVAINCNWEGTLDSVTRFLYSVQTKGAVLEVRQMTIAAGRSGSGALSGNFSIACAYTRSRKNGGAAATPAPTGNKPK
jgi:Tfp pilus assembly protein PilO